MVKKTKMQYWNEGHEEGYNLAEDEFKNLSYQEFGFLVSLLMGSGKIAGEEESMVIYKLATHVRERNYDGTR